MSADAIRALRTQSNDAIGLRNADRVVSFMTEEITVAVAGGPLLTGRDANRRAFAEQFADPAFRGYVRTPLTIAIAPDGVHATEEGHWEGRWQVKTGILTQRGSYDATWRCDAMGWRLVAERYQGTRK